MDYYLLDDGAQITEYAQLTHINDLNSLEKALLVDFLVRTD